MSTSFEKSKKTFLGFLAVRGKSKNTLKNYSSDLASLKQFCTDKNLNFQKLSLQDLENYHFMLQSLGLKPNSRRRKVLTAKVFISYLSKRKSTISRVGSERWIPPERMERPPKIFAEHLLKPIMDDLQKQCASHPVCFRNRALILLLKESGMLVSEALNLRFQDVERLSFSSKAKVTITGKRGRFIEIENEAFEALEDLKKNLQAQFHNEKNNLHFFYRYTKSNATREKITVRGVELLFKEFSKRYHIQPFHPRTLRHFFILKQLQNKKTSTEIMKMLGLKTAYSLKNYETLLS